MPKMWEGGSLIKKCTRFIRFGRDNSLQLTGLLYICVEYTTFTYVYSQE